MNIFLTDNHNSQPHTETDLYHAHNDHDIAPR